MTHKIVEWRIDFDIPLFFAKFIRYKGCITVGREGYINLENICAEKGCPQKNLVFLDALASLDFTLLSK